MRCETLRSHEDRRPDQKSVSSSDIIRNVGNETVTAIRQFACSSQGNSGITYAIVLAAVVGTVVAGGAILGSNARRTFAKVAGETTAPARPGVPASAASSSVPRPRPEIRSSTAGNYRPRMLIVLIAAIPIITVVAAWQLLRRPSKSVVDRTVPRREPIDVELLLTRLNAKRESLWHLLMADKDLLLKNQIAVRHVMTCNPITIEKSASGQQIAQLISTHPVSRLLVCDHNLVLQGVVRISDHQANPGASAEELMTSPACSIGPNSTLGCAVSLLIERGLAFLPVVENSRLCGVLTPTDLVLTLHCSLRLWLRVAQTRESTATRAEALESTTGLMEQTADQLKQRVQRLPEQVESVIRSGNTSGLTSEIGELTSAVNQLMQQLDDARAQIREQTSQINELKEAAPDEATGASSREELDRFIQKSLENRSRSTEPVSLILSSIDSYRKLLQTDGQTATDDQLRLLVECVAQEVGPQDQVARYRDDTLAIVLPGSNSENARHLCSHLADAVRAKFGDRSPWRPRMSIVSARPGETAVDLMTRAETGLAHDPSDLAETAVAEV